MVEKIKSALFVAGFLMLICVIAIAGLYPEDCMAKRLAYCPYLECAADYVLVGFGW